jgi:phosphoribosylformylglycinamidine cyclo-ligase
VDSVGSKILAAQKFNKLNQIGEDLVNHCVNDILVMGAVPMFLLDYVASAKLNVNQSAEIVKGVARACKNLGISLIGGETAEIKAMFQPNATDLVGMIVGVTEKDNMITGSNIKEGDQIMAIPSSGFHTNGYTLVNEYITEENANELLVPHRCYLDYLHDKLQYISGLVHITGGGWFDNPKRILPKNLAMEIHKKNWRVPDIFSWIQKKANISEHEMFKTFNMGVGMLVIVPPENLIYFGETHFIGRIKKRKYYPVDLI